MGNERYIASLKQRRARTVNEIKITEATLTNLKGQLKLLDKAIKIEINNE